MRLQDLPDAHETVRDHFFLHCQCQRSEETPPSHDEHKIVAMGVTPCISDESNARRAIGLLSERSS
jgi:hypothetical protein